MAEIYKSSLPATITLTNLYTAESEDIDKVAEKVWNTGLNCVAGDLAVIPDVVVDSEGNETAAVLLPKVIKGQIQIPVYGNRNLYLTLGPADTATFTVNHDEAVLFYQNMAFEYLKVEVAGGETGTTTDVSDAEGL